MLGILFPRGKLKKMLDKTEKRENLDYYYHLAEKNNMDILLYSLNLLNLQEGRVHGYLYSTKDKELSEKEVDVPKINLFRVVLGKEESYQKLKKFEEEQQVLFINLVPPRNKYVIYKHLDQNKNLKKHIPHTVPLSYQTLHSFLKEHQKVIIKPYNGAFGENIYFIQKKSKNLYILYTHKKKQHIKHILTHQLHSFYKSHLKDVPYLIQEWIPFKKTDNHKFDIRTSVQKNTDWEWEMTGIVGRVANKGKIVTNMAQGGVAIPYEELKKEIDTETYEKIQKLSIEVAKELENLFPSIADLGLDIGISENNHLWFIEANFCDERYTYRDANDEDIWFRVYQYPFEYACSLIKSTDDDKEHSAE